MAETRRTQPASSGAPRPVPGPAPSLRGAGRTGSLPYWASALDAYLATTPGGLYAVLATAQDGGADATFVLAVQVLRLFVMLLSAPLLARWLRRTGGN